MKRILPSYPLFVKDPNFSLWSPCDVLNEGSVESWFGEKKTVLGFVRVDGVTYHFLGEGKRFLPFGVKVASDSILQNVYVNYTRYRNSAKDRYREMERLSMISLEEAEAL